MHVIKSIYTYLNYTEKRLTKNLSTNTKFSVTVKIQSCSYDNSISLILSNEKAEFVVAFFLRVGGGIPELYFSYSAMKIWR